MANKPYAICQSGDWFTLIDTRTGAPASYPTTSRSKANAERAFMNREYAKALAEMAAA